MTSKEISKTFEGHSYDGPFELHEERCADNTVCIITSNGIPFMFILNAPEVAEMLLHGLRTNNVQVVDKFEEHYVRH
jgi:hypothetical protein